MLSTLTCLYICSLPQDTEAGVCGFFLIRLPNRFDQIIEAIWTSTSQKRKDYKAGLPRWYDRRSTAAGVKKLVQINVTDKNWMGISRNVKEIYAHLKSELDFLINWLGWIQPNHFMIYQKSDSGNEIRNNSAGKPTWEFCLLF